MFAEHYRELTTAAQQGKVRPSNNNFAPNVSSLIGTNCGAPGLLAGSMKLNRKAGWVDNKASTYFHDSRDQTEKLR